MFDQDQEAPAKAPHSPGRTLTCPAPITLLYLEGFQIFLLTLCEFDTAYLES